MLSGMFNKIGNGFAEIVRGAHGFTSDLANASAQGFRGQGDVALETVFNSVQENLVGHVLGGAFGPEGIGGGVVGAVPKLVRDPARDYIVDPVFGAWDWTIQEIVDRPLGTYITVMQAGQRSGGLAFFDLSTYSRAWEINDSRTFGQAMAVGLYNIDPFDENEYNSIKDDPLFNLFSGTWDFAQEFIDPATYVGANALKLARGTTVVGRAGTGLGRRFATPSRRSLMFLPRTGEIAPRRVIARGTGLPFHRTPEQIARRQQVINQWTEIRADAVLNSPEWQQIEAFIESNNIVDPNMRFAVMSRRLGRRGKRMPSEAMRLIANGPSRSARERTFRVMIGDNRIWNGVLDLDGNVIIPSVREDAVRLTESLKDPVVQRILDKRDLQKQVDPVSGDPYPVEFTPGELDRLAELEELWASTDWALFAAFEDQLVLSQQKRMFFDDNTGTMAVDPNVGRTLDELPPEIQLAGLEDILGRVNDKNVWVGGNTYRRYGLKDNPMGTRIQALMAERRKVLETDDFFAGEWVNPSTIGGRNSVIRWFSEKISHTHIFFKSENAVEQFTRMLMSAGRLNVYGDVWASGAEVNRRIGEFQAILLQGDDKAYALAADYFKSTVSEINEWVDNHVQYEDVVHLPTDIDTPIDAHLRTLTDHYNHNQTRWEKDRKITISVMEPDPITPSRRDPQGSGQRIKAYRENGNTMFVDFAMSEDQMMASSLIPRYDVVQRYLDQAQRRTGDSVVGKAQQKTIDAGRKVAYKISPGTDKAMAVWRKAVLLTPKWPMRVGFDEQLRLMANIGVLNTLSQFGPAFKRMRQAQAVHNLENFNDLGHADIIASRMAKRVREDLGDDVRAAFEQALTDDEYAVRAAAEKRQREARMKAARETRPEDLKRIHEVDTDEQLAVLQDEFLDRFESIWQDSSSWDDSIDLTRDAEEAIQAAIAAQSSARNWVSMKRKHRELQKEGYLDKSNLKPRGKESHHNFQRRIEKEVAQGERARKAAIEAKRTKAASRDVRASASPRSVEELEGMTPERRLFYEKARREGGPVKRPSSPRPTAARLLSTTIVDSDALSRSSTFDRVNGVSEVPGIGGEVIADMTQGKWQVPRAFRVGQPHPRKKKKYAALQKQLEEREKGLLREIEEETKPRSLLEPEMPPPPTAWKTKIREERASQRSPESRGFWPYDRPDSQQVPSPRLDAPDDAVLMELWRKLDPKERDEIVRASRRSGRLDDPDVSLTAPAGEGATVYGDKYTVETDEEILKIKEQIAALEITPEESVELYRQWVESGTEPMLVDGAIEKVQPDPAEGGAQQIIAEDRLLSPEEVQEGLVNGELYGKTLAVPGGGSKPNHASLLKEWSDQAYEAPTKFIGVTGTTDFQNRQMVFDGLDRVAGEFVDAGFNIQIIVRQSRGATNKGELAGSFTKQAQSLGLEGADLHAWVWAQDRGVPVIVMEPPLQRAPFYEGMDIGHVTDEYIEAGKATEEEIKAYRAYQEANTDAYAIAAANVDFEFLNLTDNVYYFMNNADKKQHHVNHLRRRQSQAGYDLGETFWYAEEVATVRGNDPLYFHVELSKRTEREIAQQRAQSEASRKAAALRQDAAVADAYADDVANITNRDVIDDEFHQVIHERIVAEYGEDLDASEYAEAYNQYAAELDPPDETIDVNSYLVDPMAGPPPPRPDAVSLEDQRDIEAFEIARAAEQGLTPWEPKPADSPESLIALDKVLNRPDYDFVDLYHRIGGQEAFEEIVNELISEMVLANRNKKKLKRNAFAKAAIGHFVVFGNPVVGATWGFMSYMSKNRKIRAAGQRKAAGAYATALRQQGRQLLKDAVSEADLAVAREMISDADYLLDLVRKEIEDSGKIKSAFDTADALMAKAGMPSLQIGNMAFRNGLGDDNRFAEAIGREVSANASMSAVWSGAYGHQMRQLENYSKPDWVRTNYSDVKVPVDPSQLDTSEFRDLYARVVNLYTSNGDSSKLQQLLWSNDSIANREKAVYKLLLEEPEILRSLLRDSHKPDQWLALTAEEIKHLSVSMVREYENVLPSHFFSELRGKARSGQYSWEEVEARIDELVEQGVINVDDTQSFQHKRVEAVKVIQNGSGDYQGRPGFGVAFGPEGGVDTRTHKKVTQDFNDLVESLFSKFGTIPSDELARHPLFASVYERELRRIIEPMLDENGDVWLSQKHIDRIEQDARREAIRETKRVMYDLAESSRAGEVLGNLSPFFNAWQEVLSRWAGFAVDNPAFVMNVARFYRKPWDAEALGLSEVEDENGNKYVVLRLFGDAYDKDGYQSTIWDALPETVKNNVVPLPIRSSKSELRFSKNGLNTMLQATPGAGPLVTVPLREALYVEPSLEEVAGFMFPFGHPNSSGFLDRLLVSNLPTYQQAFVNLITNNTHKRDMVHARMVQDIVIEQSARGDFIDYADEEWWNEVETEATRRTDDFFKFRIAAGLFSPTSTTFQSPYEEYKQSYRDLEQEYGWRVAQTLFLDRYGEEFFAATATFGRSNDGVASSLEAEEMYEKHQVLVQSHPAVGSWITGRDGSSAERYNEFSQITYQRQMTMPIAPGSDTTRRERKTGREAVEDTQLQLGWREYTEGKDIVRNYQDAAVSAGLSSSLNSNHMAAVNAWWSDYTDELKASNPVWAREFNDVHGSSVRLNAQLAGFIEGLKVPEIASRISSIHLVEYLSRRMYVQRQLQAAREMGGSDSLEAASNSALLTYWQEFQYSMSVRPEFSYMFDRYFERDLIDRDTFLAEGVIPKGWLL